MVPVMVTEKLIMTNSSGYVLGTTTVHISLKKIYEIK